MMKTLLTLATFFAIFSHSNAQEHFCGTTHVMEQMYKNNPGARELKRQEDEKLVIEARKFLGKKSSATYIIPVVVHIIHENGPENIPAANVQNVIDIMNDDFQKLNGDTSSAVSPFNSIIGDMDLEFRLATRDPNGNCTNGITRTFNPTFTNAGSGPRPIVWPRNQYLNIWVVKDISFGAGAYAVFPSNSSNPSTDGIVCRYTQFGSLPPSSSSNFSARTMTHEAGHWFNLYHPWGTTNSNGDPGNCNDDDFVGDTPNTIGVVGQGCPLSQVTCGSLDNVQNFMDYSGCALMFTAGQVARVHAALNSSVAGRNNLWQPSNLSATGTDDASYNNPSCPPTVNFTANVRKGCEGSNILFQDKSFHAVLDPSNFTYSWAIQGGTPATSSLENPTIAFNSAGFYDVSLSVSIPGVNPAIKTSNDFIEIVAGSGNYIAPYLEQVSNSSWPNNNDQSLAWDVAKPQGSLFQFQRTTNAFYSPPSSIFLNNFSFNGSGLFDVITPVADLTALQAGQAFFNFQIAHAQKTNEIENIILLVSEDCGSSFNFERAWNFNLINTAPASTSAFVPNDTSEWAFLSHDISDLAGKDNIQFMLRFNANSGNNVFLDDIHISDSDQPIPVTVGLRQDLFGEFNLYPNPNEGQFALEFFYTGNETLKVEVVDMIGSKTSIPLNNDIRKGWNTIQLNAKDYNLSTGVYILRMESGKSVFSRRLVIE